MVLEKEMTGLQLKKGYWKMHGLGRILGNRFFTRVVHLHFMYCFCGFHTCTGSSGHESHGSQYWGTLRSPSGSWGSSEVSGLLTVGKCKEMCWRTLPMTVAACMIHQPLPKLAVSRLFPISWMSSFGIREWKVERESPLWVDHRPLGQKTLCEWNYPWHTGCSPSVWPLCG